VPACEFFEIVNAGVPSFDLSVRSIHDPAVPVRALRYRFSASFSVRWQAVFALPHVFLIAPADPRLRNQVPW